MANETTPYISRNPGDVITAEDWNEAQVLIKEDIQNQVGEVETALNEFKETPVDADTFDGKTPEEWTEAYDERYVQRSELEAGWGEYRRYFKQIDLELADDIFQPAIIKHKLNRYPVVSLFELAELKSKKDDTPVKDNDGNEVKFLVYYAGHRDPDAEKLMTHGPDDVYWGDPLTRIMEQFGMHPIPTQLFDDVLNDLWGKMFDPGLAQDHFKRESYGHSAYIQKKVLDENMTVNDLDAGGMWKDLRMAIRPKMISAFDEPKTGGDYAGPIMSRVQVYHMSQDMLEITVTEAIDLMVLLRT